MPKTDFVKVRDMEFVIQMQLFKNVIGNYATLLELTPAEVAGQAADGDYFNYVLECQQSIQNSALGMTALKKAIRAGGAPAVPGEPGAPRAPVFPTYPAAVPVVATGVEGRFRALVKKIKLHPRYTLTIGNHLGIESPQHTAPDLNTVQPVISLELSGNHVHVRWGWGGHSVYLDMIELEVDRGDGQGFGLLNFDTTPGYTDPAPLPVALTKWKYRAIYRVGDNRVGLWSNEASITVGG